MSWVRVEPEVGEAGQCDPAQIGSAFTATWRQVLGDEGTALVVRYFYRVRANNDERLVCHTDYVLYHAAGIIDKAEYADCGDVDSNAEVFMAALNAPEPTDEEWLAALAGQLAAA